MTRSLTWRAAVVSLLLFGRLHFSAWHLATRGKGAVQQ